MLREESFHLGTGNNGLRRIVQAGKVPNAIVQKYLNKWIATAYDLFGSSHSSSAHWAYVWGLKGRVDEEVNQDEADLDQLNEYNRTLYHAEVTDLVSRFNKMIAPGETPFRVPDVKFHRAIGEYAGKPYSVTGDLLSPEAYDRHLQDALRTRGSVRIQLRESGIRPAGPLKRHRGRAPAQAWNQDGADQQQRENPANQSAL